MTPDLFEELIAADDDPRRVVQLLELTPEEIHEAIQSGQCSHRETQDLRHLLSASIDLLIGPAVHDNPVKDAAGLAAAVAQHVSVIHVIGHVVGDVLRIREIGRFRWTLAIASVIAATVPLLALPAFPAGGLVTLPMATAAIAILGLSATMTAVRVTWKTKGSDGLQALRRDYYVLNFDRDEITLIRQNDFGHLGSAGTERLFRMQRENEEALRSNG